MDIIIAGGGIAGCYTGQLLKQKGLNPVIFEEHPEIGKPVQCAGLVGRETVETSRIPFPEDTIVRRVDGARFYLGKEWFEIERAKAAYVVDRARLDAYLSRGLDIHTEEKIVTFEESSAIQVTTTKRMYTCDVLLGCDGPLSVIRKEGNFQTIPVFYPGVQYIMGISPEDDFIELHVKPPFFFWQIPETEETIRMGFIGPNPVHELNRFIERREMKGQILEKQAGIIALGYGSFAHERVALLGDAACQVKPLTGGGIFFSMKAAEIAVNHLDDLACYEKEWKEKFGKEIKVGLKLKSIYEKMGKKNLRKGFEIFKDNKDVIETVADFERHSSIMKEFLKYPVFWKLAGFALKEFLTSHST